MDEAKVKVIIEKKLQESIKLIKEDVYNYIKEHGEPVDVLDVCCHWGQFQCNITYLAVLELIEEGRVEKIEEYTPVRLFVR